MASENGGKTGKNRLNRLAMHGLEADKALSAALRVDPAELKKKQQAEKARKKRDKGQGKKG